MVLRTVQLLYYCYYISVHIDIYLKCAITLFLCSILYVEITRTNLICNLWSAYLQNDLIRHKKILPQTLCTYRRWYIPGIQYFAGKIPRNADKQHFEVYQKS